MEKGQVFLSQVLETMSTLDKEGRAVPFSIGFRTLQRNSKTGGRMVRIEKAKLLLHEKFTNHDSINSLRIKPNPQPLTRKNPNHWDNKTRNIKVLPQGDIKKIHINHIIEFNNKHVVY